MQVTNITQHTWPLPSGPYTVYIASVEYEDGDQVPGICEWLVPDTPGGIPDTVLCEAYVSGPRCAAGHLQVAGTPALNEYAELN